MTSRMQSCVDHIKTSCDVDPWAAEMVEKIFAEYDRRFDKVLEIIEDVRRDANNGYMFDMVNEIKNRVKKLKGGN